MDLIICSKRVYLVFLTFKRQERFEDIYFLKTRTFIFDTKTNILRELEIILIITLYL